MQKLIYLLVFIGLVTCSAVQKPNHPNVLYVAVDDLRPMFGAFGYDEVSAPNLNQLAADSLIFKNTYVQQAVCSPTRNSFLTGRRPDSTKTWNFQTSFRESGLDSSGLAGKDWTTIPELFKNNGYLTLGMRKIFHPGHPHNNDCEDPHPEPELQESGTIAERKPQPKCASWSTNFTTKSPQNITLDSKTVLKCSENNCNFTYVNPDAQISNHCLKQKIDGQTWQPTTCNLPDDECTDKWLADAALETLDAISAQDKPFFFATGFHKPHPFWAIPERFHKMYENLTLPTNKLAPTGMPDVAYYSCNSINSRSDVGGPSCDNTTLNPQGCHYITPNSSLPDPQMHRIRAGYAGGISWMDSQVGRVLQKLKDIGHYDDTIVVLHGDHGWALGEHSLYCKQANYEIETRVPLLIRVPWLQTMGNSTTSLAELVDVYPTLAELAGLKVTDALEGFSLVPVLENPTFEIKNASFSQYPRCMNSSDANEPPYLPTRDPCTQVASNKFTHMGYTIRTDKYRYTEWPKWNCYDVNVCDNAVDWNELGGRELYTHIGDDGSCFDCFENKNIAEDPTMTDIVKELSLALRAGWKGASLNNQIINS